MVYTFPFLNSSARRTEARQALATMVSVTFGKTVTRTEHLTRKGRYKLRARLAAGPSYRQATSHPVTLHVK